MSLSSSSPPSSSPRERLTEKVNARIPAIKESISATNPRITIRQPNCNGALLRSTHHNPFYDRLPAILNWSAHPTSSSIISRRDAGGSMFEVNDKNIQPHFEHYAKSRACALLFHQQRPQAVVYIPYFFLNRSTRPPASTNRCTPV